MSDNVSGPGDIWRLIAIAREYLRELIAQAAAYSGAAGDELVSQRAADQESRLEPPLKRRGEYSKSERPDTTADR